LIYDIEKDDVLDRTQTIDLSFDSVEWGKDCLYATAQFRGATRIFKLGILPDPQAVASVDDTIFVLTGDANRTSLLLQSNALQGGIDNRLYFIESSLVSPPELKFVSLDARSQIAFELFAPVPMDELSGEYPVLSGDNFQSRYITDVFSLCPEFLNGDKTMPRVTQEYIKGGGECV
jgi:hypothetical protein